jgi:hypothetical protein
VLFILLLVFASGQKEDVQIAVASEENNMSDADIKEILKLAPYDSIQNEVANIKGIIPENAVVLYFRKKDNAVHVRFIDATTADAMTLNLNATGTYNFDSTFGNFDMLTASNIDKVLLKKVSVQNPVLDWEKSDYASAQFPVLLDWDEAFAKDFGTTRKTLITQKGVQKRANTTKPIHFFLWSTIEYMKSQKNDRLLYTISQNEETYKVTATFNDFDHTTSKAQYDDDVQQEIQAYRKKIENAKAKRFTFSKSSNQLTVETDSTSLSIPIRFVSKKNMHEAGKTANATDKASTVLEPILANLKKADSKIKNWESTEFDKNTFQKTLDLPIRNSRWQQFLSVNQAGDVFDFFTEAIAFQLDETDYTSLTLNANTISRETSSKLSNVNSHGSIFWLSLLGILGASLLLVRENVSKFSFKKATIEENPAEEFSEIDTEAVDERDVAVAVKNTTPVKSEDEIFDTKISEIKSFGKLLELSWSSPIRSELQSLTDTKRNYEKVAEAKGKMDKSFLEAIKDIFPKQADYLASQENAALLWKRFSEVKNEDELKKFLKDSKQKNTFPSIVDILKTGIRFKELDKAKTFADALNALKVEQEFAQDASILLHTKQGNPTASIGEIVQSMEINNKRLTKNVTQASSITELLQHINNWYKLLHNDSDSKWKDVSLQIQQQQSDIKDTTEVTKKLERIEKLYNYIMRQDAAVLSVLLKEQQAKQQALQTKTDQEIAKTQQEATKKVAEIEKSTQQQLVEFEEQKQEALKALQVAADKKYEALHESKKTADANNKLVEKYFANLYDPHIKEFQNKARDLSHTELNKRLAFIAFNTMDLAKFVNDKWSADQKIEGNIRRILRRESMNDIPKEHYDKDQATSYINTIVGFLHKNGINEIEHLVDGIDINEELKGLK